MPIGYGHDVYEWSASRWLRVDPVDSKLGYLVDLDGFSREDTWSLLENDTAMDDLRIACHDENLLWAFTVMVKVADGLRIAPLTDEIVAYYAGDPDLEATLASASRWAPVHP